MQFCTNYVYIVRNTCYKLPKRRLYPWKSPADSDNSIIKKIRLIMNKQEISECSQIGENISRRRHLLGS